MPSILFGEPDRNKEIMESCDINDLAEYEFEGHRFMGVRDYDKYLKQWYGDYMQLPPVEKRVAKHDVVYLSTTEPYEQFKGKYYCIKEKYDLLLGYLYLLL